MWTKSPLDMGLGGFSGGFSYLMWFWCVCNKSTTIYVNQKSPWHRAGWFLWGFDLPHVTLMCLQQIHHHVCEPEVPLTWGWVVSLGVSLTSCDFDVCATNPPPCMWTKSPLDMGLGGFSGGFSYLMLLWCVCYKSTTMYVNQKSPWHGAGWFLWGFRLPHVTLMCVQQIHHHICEPKAPFTWGWVVSLGFHLPHVILMCVLQIHHHVCEPKVPLTWGWVVSWGKRNPQRNHPAPCQGDFWFTYMVVDL